MFTKVYNCSNINIRILTILREREGTLSTNGDKCEFHFYDKDGHITTVEDRGKSNGRIIRVPVSIHKCVFCGAMITIPMDASVDPDVFVRDHPEPGVIILGKGFDKHHFQEELYYRKKPKLTPG